MLGFADVKTGQAGEAGGEVLFGFRKVLHPPAAAAAEAASAAARLEVVFILHAEEVKAGGVGELFGPRAQLGAERGGEAQRWDCGMAQPGHGGIVQRRLFERAAGFFFGEFFGVESG